MKITNQTYREIFYSKKAVELNVESVKEAKQIYEGIRHYTRLVKSTEMTKLEPGFASSRKKIKVQLGGEIDDPNAPCNSIT